jgi:hypothetical protein
MGRSRAALTGALIGATISGALIGLARGGERVECEAQRVTGDGHYWAYRIIDGRECWYPGRPGKPKNELYWGRGTIPSARQTVDQPEAETETEPPEPPSRLVIAPPEKPEIAEAMPAKPEIGGAMPAEWRGTPADQLLAFTCCWPELEEPSLPPQTMSEGGQRPASPEEGRPPAWPLTLLPLGLYPLWWIARPRRGVRAIRAGDAGRVAARTRLHRHNRRDSIRERREVSAIGVVRERWSARRDDEQLWSHRQYSTGLDESATRCSFLPINDQQHVSLANFVDAPDPMAQSRVRSRLVTG